MIKNCPWTPHEDATLRAMSEDRQRLRDIARHLDRSEAATDKRMRKLGIRARCLCEAWSAEEDRKLRAMRRDGKPLAEIAAAVGRSEYAVKARSQKLRISPQLPQRRKALVAIASAPKEAVADDLRALMIANALHLLDLKRAGHSPTRTELFVPPGYGASRPVPRGHSFSVAGSPAALCAGF